MIPFLIALLGVALCTGLLLGKNIGAPTYCFLFALVALVSLVLHGFDRLQELDLKNLKMTLREMQKTKEEIFAKQEDLKMTALLMAQIMDLNNANQGRWGSAEGAVLRRNWNDKKMRELIKRFECNSTEIAEMTKFSNKYKELDELFEQKHGLKPDDPKFKELEIKIGLLSGEIDAFLRKDIDGN